MKKVLLLGAGMVAKPLADYIINSGIELTIASRTKQKADQLIKNREKGTSTSWTVDDLEKLEELVATHDVTVSLLPYAYHVTVAKLCVKHKKKYGHNILYFQ